jgi:branched-chain amino acid transport system permease protein
MDILIEILIYGSIHSMSLALMALGFALVYGTSRVPNFAHGALFIITGFIVWSFLRAWGLNYFLSIVLAIIVIGVIGAMIYQFVLIRVRGMAISEIIASYAIGLAILEGLRWGGFKGMTYTLPTFIQGSIFIAGVPVDLHRIVVLICGAGLVGFLWLFTHYTRMVWLCAEWHRMSVQP